MLVVTVEPPFNVLTFGPLKIFHSLVFKLICPQMEVKRGFHYNYI
jgi:hypothetical protein